MAFFGGSTASTLVGASTSLAGTSGLVPSPAAGKSSRALFSDASFSEPPLVPLSKPANTLIVKSYTHAMGQNNNNYSALRRPFVPIFVPADGNINKLNYRTGSGTYSAAINFNIAMWECGDDGRPSTYVIGANSSSGTASNTDIAVSVTSTAVKRGFYYISLTSDATMPANALSVNNSYAFGVLFVGTSSVNNVVALFGYTCTTYDQTTHGTIDVTTAQVCPNVGFQYA